MSLIIIVTTNQSNSFFINERNKNWNKITIDRRESFPHPLSRINIFRRQRAVFEHQIVSVFFFTHSFLLHKSTRVKNETKNLRPEFDYGIWTSAELSKKHVENHLKAVKVQKTKGFISKIKQIKPMINFRILHFINIL